MNGARSFVAIAALWLASQAAGQMTGAPAGTPTPQAWSAPQNVFIGAGRALGPALLADSAGDVHLVFGQGPADKRPEALMYARWHDGVWSDPVAVVAPGGTVASPVLALDAHGYLHMLYEGPRWGQLEYRRVHLSRAADPTAWTRGHTVSDGGALHSAMVAAPDGSLDIIFASRGSDVYFRSLSSDGRNWSNLVRVSAVGNSEQATDGADLAIDGRGRLHAVWTQFQLPSGLPPMGAYYSRSSDRGRTWTPPHRIAGENYGQVSVITRGADEVHLAWNSVVRIGERVHSWSRDGGETWSTPAVITNKIHGGWTGGPALAFDSAGVLHLITSVDGTNDVERVFHLSWDGTAWSEPEQVAGSEDATDYQEGPVMAISAGNRLHVVCPADRQRIWYRQRLADAPALAAMAVPDPDTSLRTLLANASRPFQIVLALGALFAIEALASGLWRLARGAAR